MTNSINLLGICYIIFILWLIYTHRNDLLILTIVAIIFLYALDVRSFECFDTHEYGYVKKPDMFYDPLFKDVVVFTNDADPYGPKQQNGLQKCLNKCDGRCVEFGVTGTATCFPKSALI